MSENIPADWMEKISSEETPAGWVVYRELFDRDGKLIRRDVEHLISVILSSQSEATFTQKG